MTAETAIIKGEMTFLNYLQVSTTNVGQLQQQLQQKRDSLPQLFENTPLAVDCKSLGDSAQQLDLVELKRIITQLGFVPIGIRNLPETCMTNAVLAGWAILRNGRAEKAPVTVVEPPEIVTPTALKRVEVIDRPVRSGQQVYFPDGDIVVLQHTSAGSELLAGGSVHVYGSLRGRVLAGIHGDRSARIFCQKLEAELVAIAGNYRLLDDIDTSLKKQAAMIWLEGEKLKIAPMI